MYVFVVTSAATGEVLDRFAVRAKSHATLVAAMAEHGAPTHVQRWVELNGTARGVRWSVGRGNLARRITVNKAS